MIIETNGKQCLLVYPRGSFNFLKLHPFNMAAPQS
jgi:hypothetical protein